MEDGNAVTIEEQLADPVSEDDYEHVIEQLVTEQVRDLTDALDERERSILYDHYGIGRPPRPLREIGSSLGLSAERVRQIEERALEKLRAGLLLQPHRLVTPPLDVCTQRPSGTDVPPSSTAHGSRRVSSTKRSSTTPTSSSSSASPHSCARPRGRPDLAILTRRHWSLLREELGSEADGVAFTDCDDFYVRPVDAIAGTTRRWGIYSRLGPRRRGRWQRSLSSPPAGAWSDWIAYEAIVNRALADRPAHFLCVYGTRDGAGPRDRRGLADASAGRANDRRSHPDYHDPRDVVAAHKRSPPPRRSLRTLTATEDPLEFRELLAAELTAARAPRARVMDMLVAAGEVFENARRHGGGASRVRAGLATAGSSARSRTGGPASTTR